MLRHLQATLNAITEEIAGQRLTSVPAELTGQHPGRSTRLLLGDREVGVLGELDGAAIERLELRGRAVIAEVRIDALVADGTRNTRYHQPARQPAVTHDLAVVVDRGVRAGDALAAIAEAGGTLLESAELYDEYRDTRLGDGKKGWTFRLTFRASDRTLTSDEAHAAQEAVTVALRVRCGATPRG